MTGHHCDPSSRTPRTRAWALRLIRVEGDVGTTDHDAAAAHVLREFIDCPECLPLVTLYAAKAAGQFVRELGPGALDALDAELAAVLDELERGK